MTEPVVVSIMEFSGDPEELRKKMSGIDEVARRKAPEYGGISSTVVKTDDGIMIINLWDNEEGRHKMAEDSEIRQALEGAGLPRPQARGHEVLQHRTTAGTTA